MNDAAVNQTIEHLFRHESGKMVAVLCKLLGLEQLQTAEDLAQDTLLQALNSWRFHGLPPNPQAWLHRTARNKAIDFLRRKQTFHRIRNEQRQSLSSGYTLMATVDGIFDEAEVKDSQLQMIFACCHPTIPVPSQLALALKTLCGLSAAEIAKAFLVSEETITKRIYRAKEKLRLEKVGLELPTAKALSKRLDAVLHCLYLLFNEGYNASHPERLIREELCEEAVRLAYLLTQCPHTAQPRTYALLALFCFQASRLRTRLDDRGQLVLLRHQDRSRWYRPLIRRGFYFLEHATQHELSVYHLEAAVAYLHAVAPSFEETDWNAIYFLYGILYKQRPTPFVALNKAIAALFATDAHTALRELLCINGLDGYHLYHTALGDVHFETGNYANAYAAYQKALPLTGCKPERELILGKMEACCTNDYIKP